MQSGFPEFICYCEPYPSLGSHLAAQLCFPHYWIRVRVGAIDAESLGPLVSAWPLYPRSDPPRGLNFVRGILSVTRQGAAVLFSGMFLHIPE